MPIVMHCDSLEVALGRGPDVADISRELERMVRASGVRQGSLCATVVGSTGSLTCIEFEPGVVQDLKDAVERLAPEGAAYAHEQAWHDGNGHSHVQAALLGPSLQLPVRNARLDLGTWQQPVCLNHDVKPRTRRVEVTIIGQD